MLPILLLILQLGQPQGLHLARYSPPHCRASSPSSCIFTPSTGCYSLALSHFREIAVQEKKHKIPTSARSLDLQDITFQPYHSSPQDRWHAIHHASERAGRSGRRPDEAPPLKLVRPLPRLGPNVSPCPRLTTSCEPALIDHAVRHATDNYIQVGQLRSRESTAATTIEPTVSRRQRQPLPRRHVARHPECSCCYE